jgi:GcrA cell cycle regulator
MSWTDERVEQLRQMWLDGRSASQISTAIGGGLTRNAVIGKVHRLGLAGRAKAPASQDEAAVAPRMQASAPRRGPSRAPQPMMSSAPITHGANALAMSAAPQPHLQPVRLEEDVVVPMSLRVTIVELKESMCKWPLGDPTTSEFRYCGSPTHATGPYCQHHGKLAYQPAHERRRDRDRRALMLR